MKVNISLAGVTEGKGREEAPSRKRPLFDEEDDAVDEADEGPKHARRHFAGRQQSSTAGPGTLDMGGPITFGRGLGVGLPQSQPMPSTTASLVAALASNLPPGTSVETVRGFFSKYAALTIDNVAVLQQSTAGRPSESMKVTFAKNVTGRDLDFAITELHEKLYLTCGYYLHLDRYIERISTEPVQRSPFRSEWENIELKGIAYGQNVARHQAEHPPKRLVVRVQRPTDLATLRLINMTAENTVKGGPEFEAALMADSRAMTQEEFAWLYDQQHCYAPYYRWTIHRLLTGSNEPRELYKDCGLWIPPPLIPDEFACAVADLDPNEDDSEDEENEEQPSGIKAQVGILYPRTRINLFWLLGTFPLRHATCSDLAGVTTTCVDHANEDIHEIVEMIVTNIFEPYSIKKHESQGMATTDKDVQEATINAMRIVNDLAATSMKMNTSTDYRKGPVWQYREQIGKALVDRNVFKYLAQLPAKLQMSIMATKQYGGEISYIISHWRGSDLFDGNTLDVFEQQFNNHQDTRSGRSGNTQPANEARALNQTTDVREDFDLNIDPQRNANRNVQEKLLVTESETLKDSMGTSTAPQSQRRRRPKALDFSDEE